MDSFEQFENYESAEKHFELDESQQQMIDLELNHVGGEELLLNGGIEANMDLVIETYDKTMRQIQPNLKSAISLSPMKTYNSSWSFFIENYLESPYLEAFSDKQQIEMISDYMTGIEDIRYENWKDLTLEKRLEILNEMEQKIANIEHRPPAHISAKVLKDNVYGYQTNDSIVINTKLLEKSINSPKGLDELLDTLIHEGRHRYQQYNVEERLVHESPAAVQTWRENFKDLGYADGAPVHIIEFGPLGLFTNKRLKQTGYRLYYYQPVEVDARNFAKDVMYKYRQKMEV